VARLHASLFWKLMLAFVAVVLVAVGVVALIARQTTTSEFRRLRQGERQTGPSEQGFRLAVYYAENGSWDGVSPSVAGSRRGQGQGGRGGGPPLRLADGEGRVMLDTTGGQVGRFLSASELAQGEPIVVGGQRVGTLMMGGYGAASLSQAEQEFLARVERALTIAAIAAIGTALLQGFLLFRSITAPLRRLTQATAAVAEGDLSVQVPVRSQDEIGQLGRAFNQMTSDLAHADQLRRNMTAEIAHELRTPLTVIQGNLEAIMDGVYPADAPHLEPVLRKTHLLRRLVEDLRILALADAGELELHPSEVDLAGLAQRVVRDFEVHAQASGIEMTSQIALGLPAVRADGSRIEQVLGVLLDNALRHTTEGGQIRIDLRPIHGEVWLSVHDTGEGIPPEALPQLFERFYRPTSPHSGGSGLGLAIAHAIITAHGGRIWAESEGVPGEGTTVTFALKRVT
jgi:signal transduction histidine kinase